MDIASANEKYDWLSLKMEYVSGNISVQRLGEKHGIPYSTMKHQADKGKWVAAKKKHRDSVGKKAAEKLVSRAANKLAKEYAIADKLANVLKAALEDEEQFQRHIIQTKEKNGKRERWDAEERVFNKYDMKALSDAAKTLKVVEDVKRSIGGILTVQEQSKLDIERRKMALEESKAAREQAGDNELFKITADPFAEMDKAAEEDEDND